MKRAFYLAFSVPNSNTFITANKTFNLDISIPIVGSITLEGLNFTVTKSRQGTSRNGDTKLLAQDLKANSPAQEVLDFFQKLKQLGWKVADEAFIKKHGLNKPIAAAKTPETVSKTPTIIPVKTPEPKKQKITTSKKVTQPIVATENTPEQKSEPAPIAKTNWAEKPMGPRQKIIYDEVVKAGSVNIKNLNVMYRGYKLTRSELLESLVGLQKLGKLTMDNDGNIAFKS